MNNISKSTAAALASCFLAIGCGRVDEDQTNENSQPSESVKSAATWAGAFYVTAAIRQRPGAQSPQFDGRTTSDVAYGPCSASVFPGLVCSGTTYLGRSPTYGPGRHSVYTCVVRGGPGQDYVGNGIDSRDPWCGTGTGSNPNLLWKGSRYYWDNPATGRHAVYSCQFGGGEIVSEARGCSGGKTVKEFLGYVDD